MKYANSIVTLDVTDPILPSITGESSLSGIESIEMKQIGDFLVISSYDAIVFYDNTYFPRRPRWYNSTESDNSLSVIASRENIGIVGSSEGADIFSVNDYGDIITELATFVGIENTQAIGFWGNFAVIASNNSINVYDVHNFDGDIIVDSRTSSNINEISFNEETDIMVVSRGYSGIEILDASSIFSDRVELRTGWNTISLPVIPYEGYELRSDIAAFRYDAIERRYVEETVLEPGIGYFYFSTVDSNVKFDGESIESSVRYLVPGWNLVATGSHYLNVDDVSASGVIEPTFYYYNPEIQNYSAETSVLSPNRSYWMLSLDYVTLDLYQGRTSFSRRNGSNLYSRSDFSLEPPAAPCVANNPVAENDQDVVFIANIVSPFTSQTSIDFELNESQNITAKIYDMNGRVVSTLNDSYMTEGSHQIKWQPQDNLSAGIYMVGITTEKGFDSKNIVLIK